MPASHAPSLVEIKRFDQLVAFLRDQMDWPIEKADFDDLTFDYSAEELGIDAKNAAKIDEIKSLRPLSVHQPWGVFFIKFEPKRLPVVALRRILSQVTLKKRATANPKDHAAWSMDDLLFISNYGEAGSERHMAFAHFSQPPERHDLPTLKVLGWDNLDTPLHLMDVADTLTDTLAWPEDEENKEAWRTQWRSAFTLGHQEVIKTSAELSVRLAALARAIRDRIKTALSIETETGPLSKLMKGFQTALVHDLDADGFADMYAQTIAYGLLSARITDPDKKTTDDFAAHMRTNPFLRELMETFLKIGGRRGKAGGPGIDFDELGVSDVVDLLDTANMEAVVKDFGDRNRDEDPVMHFYELFLSEYNKQLKLQRGVFYTPQPVVAYIVRSIDELLKVEYGVADGLADTTTWGEMVRKHPNLKLPLLTDEPGEKRTISPDEPFVQILDPATGTATFLVEVIEIIFQTLTAKWQRQRLSDRQQHAAWNDYVPNHLLPRLHAYELMMAPYAIAHMKVGLKLAETGYLFVADERARIFLTNSLEPWMKQLPLIGISALAHEAATVNEIKRHKRFTVVLGNPPYAQLSQNLGEAERALVAPYRFVDGARIKERGAITFERNLQDDYVKFIRLSELAIIAAGTGLSGLITNHVYLSSISLRGMRSHLLNTFDRIRLLDLHGNSKIGETAPDSTVDDNVFDIQQGVAIALFSKRPSDVDHPSVTCSDVWGSRKHKYDVLTEATAAFANTPLFPTSPNYLFVPRDGGRAEEYEAWPLLSKIFANYGSAITTARDNVVVGFSDTDIVRRIDVFKNAKLSDADVLGSLEISQSSIWNIKKARQSLQKVAARDYLKTVAYRPFDSRRLFYHDALVSSPRHPTMRNMLQRGAVALAVCRQQSILGFRHVFISNCIFDEGLVSNRSREKTAAFPLYITSHGSLLSDADGSIGTPNLAPDFVQTFSENLGLRWKSTASRGRATDSFGPQDFFNYAYSVLHSPTYRGRYAELLRTEFPRVPYIQRVDLFRELSRLGSDLVSLHLLQSTTIGRSYSKFRGKQCMVSKVYWTKDNGGTVWIDGKGSVKSLQPGSSGFSPVPEEVWNFQIGSYQVCEKWLKDRKDRTLTDEDIVRYNKIVAALGETIRLMREIDEVIGKHGGWPDAFVSRSGSPS